MIVEYVVRLEGDDIVLFLIINETDFAELYRVPGGCCGGDIDVCSEQIERCCLVAEDDAGDVLPWIVRSDDEDPRIAWTGPLAKFLPDMLGSEHDHRI